MPTLHTATGDDLSDIAAMRADEGWAVNRWLLDLVQKWEGGHILVARPQGIVASTDPHSTAAPRVIAATSAVAYGTLGFVGNVVVRSAYRRQGRAKQLMIAAINWLEGRGVRVIELDATRQGRSLYAQLGFQVTDPTWMLWAPMTRARWERLRELVGDYGVRPLTAAELDVVATCDRLAFGGDRMGLLQGMARLSDSRTYVARDADGAALGYLMMRPLDASRTGLRIGPWVAQTAAVAGALLARAVADTVGASISSGEPATHLSAAIPGASHAARDLCASLDLPLIEDDMRMRLDVPSRQDTTGLLAAPQLGTVAPVSDQPEWIYAMLSPMVG
jgi:GNAT superfamily N-acetyltransferase